MPITRRVQVDPAWRSPSNLASDMACYAIVDTDGQILCLHHFQYPKYQGALDTPEWFTAQLKIAQALADALNALPNAAIEYIRQTQREARFLQDQAEKREKT